MVVARVMLLVIMSKIRISKMKKRMIVIWVLLACLAVYAGVSEKMDVLWQIQQQQQKAITARALLQNIRLECLNDTDWYAVEQIGVWAEETP